MFSRRGARVVHGPTMTTALLDDVDATIAATRDVLAAPVDVVVLTTGIGVRSWFAAAASSGIEDELATRSARAVVVARGPKAQSAARAAGLDVAWTAPTETNGEVLARLTADGDRRAARRGAARRWGAAVRRRSRRARAARDGRRAGLPLEPARRPGAGDPAARGGRRPPARCRHVHLLVRGPQRVRAGHDPAALAAAFDEDVLAVAVGPVTAEALRDLGVPRVVEPARARLGSMVHALAGCLEDRGLAAAPRCVRRCAGRASPCSTPTAPRSS